MSYREIDTSQMSQLIAEYSISPLLAKVLISMHYTPQETASFFHAPDKYTFDEKVYQPVVQMLEKIKAEGQRVFIFGDYDCDGICATSIMMMLLDKLQIPAGYYIPSRINEGYGLNVEKLSQAYEKGYRVLVTVDNGVAATEGLKWAREHQMRVIVTDHHLIQQEVECDCLLHPSLLSEDYQYLSGGAVVYLLAKYMQLDDERMNILAMMSVIGDVMNLKGINIKIVRDGLDALNRHTYRQAEMLEQLNFPVNETDISFKIVPKINAVGRMSDEAVSKANLLVRFFLSDNVQEMFSIAQLVNELNNERRNLSSRQSKMLMDSAPANDTLNFLYHPDLHIGILGLIASRISAETNKVTFVLTDNGENVVGSGRSVGDINLMEIMEDFAQQTVQLGGHAKACGVTVKRTDLEKLDSYLHEKCAGLDTDSVYEYIDCDISDLSVENIRQLYSYRPYGEGRKLPLMKIRFANQNMQMLKNSRQLKWKIGELELLSFTNEGYDHYAGREYLTVIGNLQENRFRNRTSYQIMIKEILE